MTFITFEEKFNNEQKLKKKIKYEKELHERKTLFNLNYPNIIFENLKFQNKDIETDDNSIHYLDTENNIIYSYDTVLKYWYISKNNYIKELFY